MNRRGFIGSVIGAAVTSILPKPAPIEPLFKPGEAMFFLPEPNPDVFPKWVTGLTFNGGSQIIFPVRFEPKTYTATIIVGGDEE